MGLSTKFSSMKNFDSKDIPKAILIHELLGIAMLTITWTACYYLQISKIPFIQRKINQIGAMMPNQLSQSINNIKIPFVDKEVLSSRMGSSYIEASCFRKIIRPITLPGKIVLTYKLVQMMSRSNHKISSHELNNSTEVKTVNNNAHNQFNINRLSFSSFVVSNNCF